LFVIGTWLAYTNRYPPFHFVDYQSIADAAWTIFGGRVEMRLLQ
jgi:hypothetical protein